MVERMPWMRTVKAYLITISVIWLGFVLTPSFADYPIAGTQPDQRPEGAPEVSQMSKDRSWYDRALTGLYPPHPRSFRFLEDQGNWYTPFTIPGMTGPYDIRGWHSQP